MEMSTQRFAPQFRSQRPTCAVCGWRAASGNDDVDGRLVAVCASCRDWKPKAPPEPSLTENRDRALRVLGRMDGAVGIAELADALGDDTHDGRRMLSQVLARAVKSGLVAVTGTGTQGRAYRLIRRGDVLTQRWQPPNTAWQLLQERHVPWESWPGKARTAFLVVCGPLFMWRRRR